MKKLLAVCVALSMLLCGCVGQICKVDISEGMTGSIVINIGYNEQALDTIIEMSEGEESPINKADMEKFEYNGVTYYGEVESAEFENIDELNYVMSAYETSDAVDIMEFCELSDKSIAFAFVTGKQLEIDTTELYEMELDEETTAEFEKMIEDFIVVFEITFPHDIKMAEGTSSDAIKINGNELLVNFVELTRELEGAPTTFIFAKEGAKDVPTISDIIGFDDVAVGDWFFPQVASMAQAELVNGKTADKFLPQDTMTKAEFITVVARIMADEATLNEYQTDAGVWWDKYYNICVAEGIFTEEQFPRMNLDTGISREDMALIAYGYLKSYEYATEYEFDMDSVAQYIPDYKAIDDAKLYSAMHCYKDGILGGVDANGTFAPKKTLTRAEASTVLFRLVNSGERVPSELVVLETAE